MSKQTSSYAICLVPEQLCDGRLVTSLLRVVPQSRGRDVHSLGGLDIRGGFLLLLVSSILSEMLLKYFSLFSITMTTIGFGDIVPGEKKKLENNQKLNLI